MIKVLIADDEIHICRLIQALIQWDSLEMEPVGVANNGMEAISLVKEKKPDILITDIRMPGCYRT
jgi:two-component system response regulator YesN